VHFNAKTNFTIEERLSVVTDSELLAIFETQDVEGTARNIWE
jgi:hypothetical protein